MLLDVAKLRLRLAEVLLNGPFCLQRLVTHKLTGSLLDGSLRLFEAALKVIFVDAHDVLQVTGVGKGPVPRRFLEPGAVRVDGLRP